MSRRQKRKNQGDKEVFPEGTDLFSNNKEQGYSLEDSTDDEIEDDFDKIAYLKANNDDDHEFGYIGGLDIGSDTDEEKSDFDSVLSPDGDDNSFLESEQEESVDDGGDEDKDEDWEDVNSGIDSDDSDIEINMGSMFKTKSKVGNLENKSRKQKTTKRAETSVEDGAELRMNEINHNLSSKHQTIKLKKSAKKSTTKMKTPNSGGSQTDGESKANQNEPVKDEYEDDSSDEEDLRNTIGNIPINWYDEYDHLGYDLDSLPIMKPKKGDTLDKFLQKLENPDYHRTVFDKQTGQDVKLSDEHLDLVQRLLCHKVPNASFDMYAPFPDLYSHEVMKLPLSGRPEHKRSFLPSKHERRKVASISNVIRREVKRLLTNPKEKKEKPKFYDLWRPRGEDEGRIRGVTQHIPPPKVPLPGHGESYNPPPEYLISDHEARRLESAGDGDGVALKSLKYKYKSVREIPRYPRAVQSCFSRLMDLYLAPRLRYQKVTAKAKEFLPKLPDKRDLRPYPTLEGMRYLGHLSIIRTISVHPAGKYMASGSDDNTIRIWEISTGRCLRTFEMGYAVKKVCWNPNPKLFLLGVAMRNLLVFLNPETYLTDKIVVQQTNAIFEEAIEQGDYIVPERIDNAVKWRKPTTSEWSKGFRVILEHFKEVKEIAWHKQGDYFASVVPDGDYRSVIVHQLSRWRSQLPFKKSKGRVQSVQFHPRLPQLFVCTQAHVRVYDLKRQALLKKISAKTRWISSMSVHPGGEHFILGGYDRRVNWFEMECTKRPHTMRYHTKAVRGVSFHRKYPLYASCSDDRLIITHATVYDDWLSDPLIVPLKQLRGHWRFDDLYVLDVTWHPYEPFLFSAGADATIRLWH